MISLDPAAITAMVGIVTLLLLAAGGAYWLGKLSNRVDQLGKQVDQLSTDIRKGSASLGKRCAATTSSCCRRWRTTPTMQTACRCFVCRSARNRLRL